jgi:hypothetical protein
LIIRRYWKPISILDMLLLAALYFGVTFLLAVAASAATVDFSTVMTDMDGQPLPTSQSDKTPVTLGTVADTALLNSFPDEKDIGGDEKVHRFTLAVLVKSGKVDLTVENITLIKTVIAKAYGPLIVGRAWAILDPKPAEEPKK